jgi:hypothetical protein
MLEILGVILIFALLGSIKGGPDEPLSKLDIVKLIAILAIIIFMGHLWVFVLMILLVYGIYRLLKKMTK